LYSQFDPDDRTEEAPESWKLPDYGTVDIILRHGFKVGDFDASITARLYNAFNTDYIGDALDGSTHDETTALVWFANGRSFNIGVQFNF